MQGRILSAKSDFGAVLVAPCLHSRGMANFPGRHHPVYSRRDPRLPAGRTLHLIDFENLMGGPQAGTEAMGHAKASYLSAVTTRAGDHVIVGANPALLLDMATIWPGARPVIGRGPDGADLALLAEARPADVALRFDRIVIGSGDGIFANLAAESVHNHLVVIVVSRPESLSRALAAAAPHIRYLMGEPSKPTDGTGVGSVTTPVLPLREGPRSSDKSYHR